MIARLRRTLDPVDAYVSAVILAGTLCTAVLAVTGARELLHVLTPEVGAFFVCALVGELVPLKVFTRGAEGEITTTACFAVALMLVSGPLVAFLGLAVATLAVDLPRRKPAKKIAFNIGQYAISLALTAAVLSAATGIPRTGAPHLVPSDLPGVLAAGTVNTAIVPAVIALVQDVSVFRYMVQDLFFQAATAGLLLGLSPVVVLAATSRCRPSSCSSCRSTRSTAAAATPSRRSTRRCTTR